MQAFEVWLNGMLMCTAGIESGTTVIMFSRVANTEWQKAQGAPPECNFSVTGVHAVNDTAVEWVDRPLSPGDEVLVRVVEQEMASPAVVRRTRDPEEHRAKEEKYVEHMAARLGWRVIKPDEQFPSTE